MATRLLLGTDAGLFAWEAVLQPRLTAGPVTALARRAPDARVIYAATADRIFRSPDGGVTWHETAATFPGFAEISSLAVHPHDDEIVLAGLEPSALFRTSDGGRTWVEDPAIRAMAEAPQSGWHVPWSDARGHVRTPVFDPVDPDRIYLPIEVGGVVRTEDGGRHWENVRGGIHDDVHALAVNPVERRVIYAATRHGCGRSDDYGRTWRETNRGLTKTYCRALAVDPRDGRRLFTAGAPTPPGRWHLRPAGAEASLFRSDDGGETWRLLVGGLPPALRGYVDAIALAPAVPDRVCFGTADGEVWQSDDGGETWCLLLRTHPVRRLLILA